MAEKVYGEGNRSAQIMFIGEAPGAQEAKKGKPFVGPSGATLNTWISQLGLERAEVYITNLIKEKLPKNRNPNAEEIQKYKPLLFKEIGEVDPKVIITLGLVPVTELIQFTGNLGSIVGNIHQVKIHGKDRLLMALYHPAYINRCAEDKKEEMLDHLLYLKRVLDNV